MANVNQNYGNLTSLKTDATQRNFSLDMATAVKSWLKLYYSKENMLGKGRESERDRERERSKIKQAVLHKMKSKYC